MTSPGAELASPDSTTLTVPPHSPHPSCTPASPLQPNLACTPASPSLPGQPSSPSQPVAVRNSTINSQHQCDNQEQNF